MNTTLESSKRAVCHESGQAMVEFALVITFIFLLFVSIVQMILYMYAYNTLADAAKEGVRYAIVHGTGIGGAACSGPGTATGVTPSVTCTDASGTNVVNAVVGPTAGSCNPTCGFAALSFQNIATANGGCSTTPAADSVNVCYDPGGANTSNTTFNGQCSQPGCQVRVTVQHTYNPLFGLGWPSFTMSAAASGTIAN
jgi:Flp pilus assembly protein TadG